MILNVKMLSDGSGRVCIHWLIQDEAGPIKTTARPDLAKLTTTSGRIACNPKQNSVNPVDRNGEHLMCLHSPEVRAVTCPKCLATPEAIALLATYADTMEISGEHLYGQMQKPEVSHEIPQSVVTPRETASMLRK